MNPSTANEPMAGASRPIWVECQAFRNQLARKARVWLVGPVRNDRICHVVRGMEQRRVASLPGLAPFGIGKLRTGEDEYERADDWQPQVSKKTKACPSRFSTLWPCAGRARFV